MGLFRKELLLVGLVLSLSTPPPASPYSFERINAFVTRDAPVHAEPSSYSDVIAELKPGMIIHMNPSNSCYEPDTIPTDDPPGYWHKMGFIERLQYGGYSVFDHEDDYDIAGYVHSNNVSEYFFRTKDYDSGDLGYVFIAMEVNTDGGFTNNLYYMGLDLAKLPRGVVDVETLDIQSKYYLDYSDILGVAKRGEVLTVLYPSWFWSELDGDSGHWLRVLTSDGVEGWAFGPYIDVGDGLDRFIYEEAFSEPIKVDIGFDEETFEVKGGFGDFMGDKAIKVHNTSKYPIAVYEYVATPYNGWTTFCEYVFFALGGGGGSFLELYHWKVNYYDPGSSIEFGNYNVSGDGYIEYKYASFDDVGLHDTTTRSGYIGDHAISVGEGRIRVPESGTYDYGLLPEPSEITYESAEVLFETVVEAGLYSELVFNEDGNPDGTYLIKTLDPGAEVNVDGYSGWRLYLHCTGSIDGWISASDVVLAGGEPGFIRMSE